MTQVRNIRQRVCIGCGSHGAKERLCRIVRTPEGAVAFDVTGRAAGRGAYVCSAACLAKAGKTRKLERALRTGVSKEDFERIAGEIACVVDAIDQE